MDTARCGERWDLHLIKPTLLYNGEQTGGGQMDGRKPKRRPKEGNYSPLSDK